MELRYGILSTSSIAPRFIAAVRQAGAGEILALSSRSEEKAREKAAQWDIPRAYGSHAALLQDKDINIVYISTVNSLHYAWAKAALEQGKHVICEKPFTVSSVQTRELFALAKEKGLFLMEAQKMLFLPAVLALRRCIEEGQLGEISMVQMSSSFDPGYNNWLFDPEAGGGTLLTNGVYGLELMLWLFGSIRSIRGVCTAMPGQAEWQFAYCGETESGVVFTMRNTTRGVLENEAVVYGTQGTARLPSFWKARELVVSRNGQESEVLSYPCAYELVYEAQHIAECLKKGLLTSPVVTPELTLQAIEAIEKLKTSW